MYNQSGRCKHVAALIHYINNEQSLTKTDHEQEWGKPTTRQLAKIKYSKGKYFDEMFTRRTVRDATPTIVLNSELNEPSALRSVLLQAMKPESEGTIRHLMDSMLTEVDIILKKEECEMCVDILFILQKNQVTYTSYPVLLKEIDEFYKKFIVKSRKEIIQLCCDTLEQSNCQSWFEARKLRISASINVHCIKRRVKKPVESIVAEMLYPKDVKTAATRYGRDNESLAAEKYQKVHGTNVKKVGLIVSEQQPWLCASLDGVVFENGTISKIVEFKCPSSCAKLPIVDFEKKQCNVPYLQIQCDLVELKKSAPYYTQCQVQMYVSGLNLCDLFMYSPVENGSFCVQIHRDEKFIREVIIKSESFYFQHFLPTLHSKLIEKESRVMKIHKNHFTGNDISNQIHF